MAFVLADRVQETTTTTGTANFALGGAVVGFQSFASGVGANNTCYYTAFLTVPGEWEVGLGTLSADGLTLARTTVYKSTNSNALVNFSAGTKYVFVDYPASKSINQDTLGQLVAPNSIVEKGVNLSSGLNMDLSLGNYFYKSITAATSFTVSNVTASPATNFFMLELTNAGLYSISFSSFCTNWAYGIKPTFTGTGTDLIAFVKSPTLGWVGLVLAQSISYGA